MTKDALSFFNTSVNAKKHFKSIHLAECFSFRRTKPRLSVKEGQIIEKKMCFQMPESLCLQARVVHMISVSFQPRSLRLWFSVWPLEAPFCWFFWWWWWWCSCVAVTDGGIIWNKTTWSCDKSRRSWQDGEAFARRDRMKYEIISHHKLSLDISLIVRSFLELGDVPSSVTR